jgi:RHS repeat-associated protein
VLKAAYGYDGLNRRISEQVAASAAGDAATAAIRDLFYSADWQVLEERLRSGGAVGATAEARYVWSPVYVDAMVLRERGSERVYALQDGNWNTTALIAAAGVPGKATGDLIQRMVYNPYGEVFLLNPDWTEQLGAPLVAWQHLFQGLKFTEATGLGYVRNRDYSPALGRFIMLDPIGFSAGDNNWYRFVGNGPVGRVDPWGLQECWESSWETRGSWENAWCQTSVAGGAWHWAPCDPPILQWVLRRVHVWKRIPCPPPQLSPCQPQEPGGGWVPAKPPLHCVPGYPCYPPGHPFPPGHANHPFPPGHPYNPLPPVPVSPPLVPVSP